MTELQLCNAHFFFNKTLFTLVHLTENTAFAKQGLKTMLNLQLS